MLKQYYPLEQAAAPAQAEFDITGDFAIADIAELGGEPYRLADGRIVPINPGAYPTSYVEGRAVAPVKNPWFAFDNNLGSAADEREASWGGGRWYIPAAIIRKMVVVAGGAGGASFGSLTNIGALSVPANQKKTFEAEFRQVTRTAQNHFYWWEPTGSRGVIYEIDYWTQQGKFTNPEIKVGHIIDIDFTHPEVQSPAYIVQQVDPHWILSPVDGAPLILTKDGIKPSPSLNFDSVNTFAAEMTARILELEARNWKIISEEEPDMSQDWEEWIHETPEFIRIYKRLGDEPPIMTFDHEIVNL